MDVGSLPEGARVLHIGIPKTGTTALQTAAATARPQLLEHGVLYPGRGRNHVEAVCALMGRRFGWTSRGTGVVPPRSAWTDLMAEIERHPGRRILISHEFASESDDAQARTFAAELGPQTYVVLTLRSFATLLGSSWQQHVKAGRRTAYPNWLRAVLAESPHGRAASLFHRRNDQPAILRRWCDAVGADRVIVVVPDKSRPRFVLDAFADLLAVPRAVLHQPAAEGENRSMSWPEVEYLRRLNQQVRRQLDGRQYEVWVRNGAVTRMLTSRRPRENEPGVTLPPWAADRAEAIATSYAAAVADAGCRIIGNVEALAAPALVGNVAKVRNVPLDAAVAAAAGLVSAGLGRGAAFDVADRPLPPLAQRLARSARGRRVLELNDAVPTARAGDLLWAGLLRAARQMRHRLHP